MADEQLAANALLAQSQEPCVDLHESIDVTTIVRGKPRLVRISCGFERLSLTAQRAQLRQHVYLGQMMASIRDIRDDAFRDPAVRKRQIGMQLVERIIGLPGGNVCSRQAS